MSKVCIITDSNSGITQSESKELGIVVIPMPFYINEVQHFEDIDMTQEQFYEALMDEKTEVSTSQPSPDTIMQVWRKKLGEYEEIVHIPMSSGISSSCSTAMMLAQEEEFEGKVFVVDNQRISVTQRRSVQQAKELAEIAVSEGMTDNEKEKACEEALQKHLSVDVALFGRMVAVGNDNKKKRKQKELNCDASAQVAHSISTHTVQNEYDYFTAVDDLAPEDSTGAGHLGTVEFNSSTLYRYATVNLVELSNALGKQVAAETAAKFVEAFVRSMPTGKQNTFANRTLPSMVYVTIRRDQPVNLCGAFEKPVSAKNGGYSEESEEKFVEYANKVYGKYASAPDRAFAVGEAVGELAECMNLDRLLESVAECVKEYLGESEGM